MNAPPSLPASRWQILACAFLAAVTLAVYWPAHSYKFVAYDDDVYVYNNPTVLKGLTWSGVEWAFVDRQANNWHPLTWLTHMLDCQLFGLNAGGPHMVNVALHCANAVLLFLLLQSLFLKFAYGTPEPNPVVRRFKPAVDDSPSPGGEGRGEGEFFLGEERASDSISPPPSNLFWRNLFIAALFALHPLRVESVAWISERKDVLSAFFGLLALLCYALYANQDNSRQQSRGSPPITYYLSLVFFTCSLLSKPTFVTLPLVLLLLDYWPLQRLQTVSHRDLLREKWPFFSLAAAFCVITIFAQQPGLPSQHLGLFDRMEGIATNYLGYLEKLLWPQNLSFLYLRPDTIPPGQFVLALLVLLSVSALAFACRQRCPAFAMGWLWFLIVLLPVCGIVSLGRLSIADRYTYLPGIGFYLMITWGLADLAEKLFPLRAKQILLGTAAVIVLAVCVLLSRQQLAVWQNTETLYRHALAIDPHNDVAQQNLHIYQFEIANPGIRKPPPE